MYPWDKTSKEGIKCFKNHLFSPGGVCARVILTWQALCKGITVANTRQAVGVSRLRHAWLAEGKDGWKTSQDEEEGTGNAEVSSPKVLISLKSLTPVFWGTTTHPVQLVFVCSLDVHSLGAELTQPAWEPVHLCHCSGSAPGVGVGASLLHEMWVAAAVFLSIGC